MPTSVNSLPLYTYKFLPTIYPSPVSADATLLNVLTKSKSPFPNNFFTKLPFIVIVPGLIPPIKEPLGNVI
jgi:hypothetical protein